MASIALTYHYERMDNGVAIRKGSDLGAGEVLGFSDNPSGDGCLTYPDQASNAYREAKRRDPLFFAHAEEVTVLPPSGERSERDRKVEAVVDCMLQGADEAEVYRLGSLNGWDTATLEAGIEEFYWRPIPGNP